MVRTSRSVIPPAASGTTAGRRRPPGDAGRRRLAALTSSSTTGRVRQESPVRVAPDVGDDGDVIDEEPAASTPSRWQAGLATTGPWGALAERWVPEPLREVRIDPGKHGAVVLCAVAALAALVAAIAVWLNRPTPVAVPPPSVTGAGAGGAVSAVGADGNGDPLGSVGGAPTTRHAGSEAADVAVSTAPASRGAADDDAGTAAGAPPAGDRTGPAESGLILVSVTGKVRRPGVVRVAADARVLDAIEAAGGVADVALLAGMNLAARVSDGSSVVVAGPDGNAVLVETSTGSAGDSAEEQVTGAGRISLNAADAAALERIPGIGPVTAAAIIAYRTQHGAFAELSQLQDVSGIGPATYARLVTYVRL